MEQTLTTVISIVTAIGFGGVIGAYFQSLFQRRTQIDQQQFEHKQKRYLSIMIQMLAKLDFPTHLPKIKEFRPNLQTIDDLDRELESELPNGFIYASDDSLESLSNFIRRPDHKNFVDVAISMRRDLYGRKTSVDQSILSVIRVSNDKTTK